MLSWTPTSHGRQGGAFRDNSSSGSFPKRDKGSSADATPRVAEQRRPAGGLLRRGLSNRSVLSKLQQNMRALEMSNDGWMSKQEFRLAIESLKGLLGKKASSVEEADGMFDHLDADQIGRTPVRQKVAPTRRPPSP